MVREWVVSGDSGFFPREKELNTHLCLQHKRFSDFSIPVVAQGACGKCWFQSLTPRYSDSVGLQ